MDLLVLFAAAMAILLVWLGAMLAADIREPVPAPIAVRPPLAHRTPYRPVHRL